MPDESHADHPTVTSHPYIYRGGSRDGDVVELDQPLPQPYEIDSGDNATLAVESAVDQGSTQTERYVISSETEDLDDGRPARVIRLWRLE